MGVGFDETDANGDYPVGALEEGQEYCPVYDPFDSGYTYEYWDDKFTSTTATRVTYTGGLQDGFDVGMTLDGATPPTPPVQPLVNVTPPSITGSASVGSTQIAGPGAWNPAPTGLAFQWNADGAPVPGATAATYALPADQVGKRISVTVTAAASGVDPASATSAPVAPVAPGTVAMLKKPKLDGKARSGPKLSVKTASFAPSGGTVTLRVVPGGPQDQRCPGQEPGSDQGDEGQEGQRRGHRQARRSQPVVVQTKAKKIK